MLLQFFFLIHEIPVLSFAFVLCIYLPTPFGFGDTPLLRCIIGERFGDRLFAIEPTFSFSGDGDEPPPVAEFRRDGVKRTVVSK